MDLTGADDIFSSATVAKFMTEGVSGVGTVYVVPASAAGESSLAVNMMASRRRAPLVLSADDGSIGIEQAPFSAIKLDHVFVALTA